MGWWLDCDTIRDTRLIHRIGVLNTYIFSFLLVCLHLRLVFARSCFNFLQPSRSNQY